MTSAPIIRRHLHHTSLAVFAVALVRCSYPGCTMQIWVTFSSSIDVRIAGTLSKPLSCGFRYVVVPLSNLPLAFCRILSHFFFFHFTSTRHSFIHVSLTFVPFFPYVWKLPKHSIVSENSLTPFFYSSLHELQFERFHFKPLVWGLMIILTFLLLSLFAEFLSWPDCCRVRSAAVWPSPKSHLRSQQ